MTPVNPPSSQLKNNALHHQVAHYAHELAQNPLFIQGAGGNASWKEDSVLWVKASGLWMADALTQDLFVPVDLNHLKTAIAQNNFECTPQVLGSTSLRPSIETWLHGLMPQKFVFHIHAIEPLVYLIQKNAHTLLKQRLPAHLKFSFIPYHKPGPSLAQAVFQAIQTQPDTEILLLESHGIVVAGNKLSDIQNQLESLLSALNAPVIHEQIHTHPIPEAFNAHDVHWEPLQEPLQSLVHNPKLMQCVKEYWALCPDHVVFLGPIAAVYHSREHFITSGEHPILAFIQGEGVFHGPDWSRGRAEQLAAYYHTLLRLPNDAQVNVLTDHQVSELLNWDAERYRQHLEKNNKS